MTLVGSMLDTGRMTNHTAKEQKLKLMVIDMLGLGRTVIGTAMVQSLIPMVRFGRVNGKTIKKSLQPKKDYTNQYAHHAKGDIICHRARVFPVPETELQNQELLVLILATD